MCSATEVTCACAKPSCAITRFYKSRQAAEARQTSDARQARYIWHTAVEINLNLSFLLHMILAI